MKFYQCKKCGKIEIVSEAILPECCGEKMAELTANTVDAAVEKHVPVCKREGENVRVAVGEVPHPMEEEHYIQYIWQVEGVGAAEKPLRPSDEPEVVFSYIEGAEYYAYCNKHGLWKAAE